MDVMPSIIVSRDDARATSPWAWLGLVIMRTMPTSIAIAIIIASLLLVIVAVTCVFGGVASFFGLGGLCLLMAGAGVVAVNMFA